MENKYGKCEICGDNLKPVWFLEEETKYEFGILIKTGRVRQAVSHLSCPSCLNTYCVDDSFDKPWYLK